MAAGGFPAFCLSIFLLLRCFASQHPDSDGFFVVDFFRKMKAAPPPSVDGDSSSQVCSWQGVSCEGRPERVIGLVTPGFGLSGPIPETTISELGDLRVLDLSDNNITSLPLDFAKLSASLRSLNLSSNKIRAAIPADIGDFELMESLDLSRNEFSGKIPAQLGSLSRLRVLNLGRNSLEMSIPDAVLGCASLIAIDLSHNRLNGTVPTGFGAAFKNLTTLDLSGNQISGKMPDFSELNSIAYLNLSGNIFQQLALGVFQEPLQVIDLSNNQFHGLVSQVNLSSISNLSSLVHLDLSMNELTGEFFPGLGDLHSLKHLNLAFNKFSSQDFHNIEMPSSIEYLNLSRTNLTGRIPPGISRLTKLKVLDLSQNHIAAGIPVLRTGELQVIELSVNNLTGEIPKSLQQKLSSMQKFNFSYNNLTFCGEKFSPKTLNSSFIGLQSDCPIAVNPDNGVGKKHTADLRLVVAIAFSMLFTLAGLVCLVLALRRRTGRWTAKQTSYREELTVSGPCSFQTDSTTWTADIKLATSVPVVIFEKPLLNFTFADLLTATCHFDRGTLLAEGQHGPVYRGFLPGGIHVAVKVLVPGSSVTDQEAERELERLGHIKHLNLVPLTGYCLAGDRRIAIYDFMENGNLQNLLHDLPLGVQSTDDWTSDTWEQDTVGTHGIMSEGMTTWKFRHNIALGIARALAFLHHGCLPQIVHGNVKTSSIYLDSAMEPRLTGFGLAGIVGSSIQGEMSLGYTPPESSESENAPATTKSDVFRFGVVLFELITGKKPTEDEYDENKETTLVSWARALVRRKELARLVDARIQETGFEKQLEEGLRIAYLCTADLPLKRPSMQQIVGLLKDIEPVTAEL